MSQTAKESGYTSASSQLEADIAKLDQMDEEISRLLKKRKNKNFTEKDKVRLQELIDAREAIEVTYKLTPLEADGFETIRQKLEAKVARAQARGKTDADASVYENAMVAAAQGMAAVNAELDAQYDKEYALIALIEDGAEKQQALPDLNNMYNQNRKAAAEEYAKALQEMVVPVWNQADIQQAGADIDTLVQSPRIPATPHVALVRPDICMRCWRVLVLVLSSFPFVLDVLTLLRIPISSIETLASRSFQVSINAIAVPLRMH